MSTLILFSFLYNKKLKAFFCDQVIEDFHAENVIYLELRTTPKVNIIEVVFLWLKKLFRFNFLWQNKPAENMTKRSYIESVLLAMSPFHEVEKTVVRSLRDDQNLRTDMADELLKTGNEKLRYPIFARLLLSIDRRETTESAIETVRNEK